MMEFTLSRVVLAVCGVLLLGAVIAPFTVSEENVLADLYQEETEAIASTIDSFYESPQDTSFVDMNRLLPDSDCSLSFDGRMVKLNDGKNEYTAFCEHYIESDGSSYDSNDLLILMKDDGKVIVCGIR